MIEFYYHFSKKSYKAKATQLCRDLKRLFLIENIEITSDLNDSIIPNEYKTGLNNPLWDDLISLYSTLYANLDKATDTLRKYVIKSENNRGEEFLFIDTFAGCGGLSLGLSKAGFHPLLINEIEHRFLETYYFNHDLSIDNYFCCDIKDFVNSKQVIELDDVDLVVGGPPCQGFSMANRQRLLDDPRNKLYKEFLNLLETTRPKFFIMENVKGMMNKSSEILENFTSILGDDYRFEIRLLNAKDFGIPQNRERVIVIGTRLPNACPKAIFDTLPCIQTNKFVLRDALKGLPVLQPKRDKNQRGIENGSIGFKFSQDTPTKTPYSDYLNDGQSYPLCNHTNRYNNDRDIEIFGRLPQGANSLHESIADIMPYADRNHIFKDKYFKLDENVACKTITSHMKLDCNMYIHPSQPRGLSPREAARMQTFPDDYIFMGANNTWYAQIGNAVPVKLAQIIGEQIMDHLNGN